MMTFEANIPNRDECRSCPLTFAYKEIALLYDIAMILTSTTNIHESIEKSMRRLKQNGYLERCAIFKKKEELDELELLISIDLEPYQKKSRDLPFWGGGDGIGSLQSRTHRHRKYPQ